MIKYGRSALSTFSSEHSLPWFQAGPSQGVQKRLWTETLTSMLTPFPPVVAAEKQISSSCVLVTLYGIHKVFSSFENQR